MKSLLSNHFKERKPSSIRQAQIKFSNREDRKKVKVINLAIGNVSLPIHPSMRKRMEIYPTMTPLLREDTIYFYCWIKRN